MNIPVDRRMQDTISRIENRSNRPKGLSPQYYREKYEYAKRVKDFPIARIYLKCSILARENTPASRKRIVELLTEGNRIMEQRKNRDNVPARPSTTTCTPQT